MTEGLSAEDRWQVDDLVKQLDALLERAMRLLEKANPETGRREKVE